ncbi:hypothetical protein WA026_020849 [Henosepilachna vigintioctopunctata]|uniref:C2H2-type domain-containing protein n=1 Tax=Henosepilachna vigintioctopunctata TaxID=420089 RepID=A0AAW1US32_9CUCU
MNINQIVFHFFIMYVYIADRLYYFSFFILLPYCNAHHLFDFNQIFFSEFLEFDKIYVPPTLKSLLKSPKHSRKGQNGHSMRKYNLFSDQIVRPGYSSDSQFACRHCGKRYRWKSTMRRHEQVECGGKEPMFICPYCPYRAKQKGNLGVHIRKHHNRNATNEEINNSIQMNNPVKTENYIKFENNQLPSPEKQ